MAVTTGNPKGLSQWSTEYTVEFVQVPPEKEQAYFAAVRYFAQVLKNSQTVPEAAETVNG